jgi:hypothetical protein
MGLVSEQQRMLYCDINLSLMKTAVASESSMARVQVLLLVPLTMTEKRRCEENRSTVYTVQEKIESNIVRDPLSDGISEITELNNTALLWVCSKNLLQCWSEALRSIIKMEPQSPWAGHFSVRVCWHRQLRQRQWWEHVTRGLKIERNQGCWSSNPLKSSLETTAFEQSSETNTGIVVWPVTVVAGDVGVQLCSVLVAGGFTAGAARRYVLLPDLANVRDCRDQRWKICQFWNDRCIDVHGIWITEELRDGGGQVTGDRSLGCMVSHMQVVLEIVNLRIDLVTVIETELDMTRESSRGIERQGGRQLEVLTHQPDSYSKYLAQ